jgi:hypothetical protein
MAVFDLFSKRQKKIRGEDPDVYQYDNIPNQARVQVIHIWDEVLGNEEQYWNKSRVNQAYEFIVNTLRKEYGVFQLSKNSNGNKRVELGNFLLQEEMDKAIDAIELGFRVIDKVTRDYDYLHRRGSGETADSAIEELNIRFQEAGIGYRYENGKVIRIDSEFIHKEVVKPVLVLLSQQMYRGAQEEFLKAHEHYRNGAVKEAMNEALKAFESTMKAIYEKRKWSYDKTAPSQKLLQVCFDKDLVPAFWQSSMSALRALLEGGVPTGRNKLSGHGQGATPVEVPMHIAGYMLHMTASAIVFLAEAEKKLN